VALTWQQPITGALIGPGYEVSVTSGLVGPIPQNYFWRVAVYSTDGREAVLLSQEWNAFQTQHQLTIVLGDPTVPLQQKLTPNVNVLPNADVRLQVDLVDQSGQRVDGDIRNTKWDPTGRMFVVDDMRVTGSGSFTPTDRALLEDTQAQTQVALPTEVSARPIFDFPLGDWLTLSHGTQYVRGGVQLLSGRGSLSVHDPGRGVAFGFVFSWFTVPAELSKRDGLQPVYDASLLDVGIVYADGGLDLYYERLLEFQTDGHFVEWPNLRWPQRIDYWVYPGVVVALQFMHVPSA